MKFLVTPAFMKHPGASAVRAAGTPQVQSNPTTTPRSEKSVTLRRMGWKAALVLPYFFSTALLQAEVFPPDSGVINVETYGASGGDLIDDTAAIRRAIDARVGTGVTLYFPNGTYFISKTLDWKKNNIKSRVKIPDDMLHPLAAGLGSDLEDKIYSVYSSTPGGLMNYAAVKADTPNTPGVNAIKVASAEGSGSGFLPEWAIFAFETGVIMNNQLRAPARRVGFFVGSDNTPSLTTAGWQLFDAAVNWARSGRLASAWMVVGDPANLQVTDVAIRARMAGMGIDVAIIDDRDSQSINAMDKGFVYISASVERVKVKDAFRNVPVPVICSKAELYAAMSMATGDCRTWMNRMSFMGESRTGTIIKLQDDCEGFTEDLEPQAMIATASSLSGGAPSPYAGGGGDAAYHNNILDITVDCGEGNAGAVGIDYMANNCGAIRNVLVRSSDDEKIGKAGINVTRSWVGPCLIQNVTVDGFDYGIKGGDIQYGITLDKITLTNQNTYGIETGAQVFHICDLTSTNEVPAIHLSSEKGQLTLVNGTFNGGDDEVSAIKVKDGTCKAYVRNVTSIGYRSCIELGGSMILGNHHDQYVVSSMGIFSLFSSPQTSLELPIQSAPPVYYSNDFANQWISVTAFRGANPNDALDDTAAIRDAMAAGRPIVYFPKGSAASSKYIIKGTIEVPAHVKRIIGVGTDMEAEFDASEPAFRFTGGTASDVTTIERFWARLETHDGPYIQNDSPRTLYFRDITFGRQSPGYRNSPGAGKCFFENVVFTGSVIFDPPQEVWARQLNVESDPGPDTGITNAGGNLWILGLKTEQDFTAIKTTRRGNTELLGGFLMPGVRSAGHPANIGFINEESSHSLIYTTYTGAKDDDFPTHVQEKRDGVTSNLLHGDVIHLDTDTSTKAWMPLYVGYKDNTILYFTHFLGGAGGEPTGWAEASANIMGLDVINGDYRCINSTLWGMAYSTAAPAAASGHVVSTDFRVTQTGRMGGPLIGDMTARRYFWARYNTTLNKLQICFLSDATNSFTVIAEAVASQPFNVNSNWAIDFGYSGNIIGGSTADTTLTASLFKDGQLTARVTTPTAANVAATRVGIKTNNLILFKNFSLILP